MVKIKLLNSSSISIHAPREGSDYGLLAPTISQNGISIHAPREGSDIGFSIFASTDINFNPRSP